jgi:hypothetical protein
MKFRSRFEKNEIAGMNLCYSPEFPIRSFVLSFFRHVGPLATFVAIYSLLYPVPEIEANARAVLFGSFAVSLGGWVGQRTRWHRKHLRNEVLALNSEALDAITQAKRKKA